MLKRTPAFAIVALAISGCGHNHEWFIRQPGVESTIGTDPSKAPAGKLISPSGMGVDPVGRRMPD